MAESTTLIRRAKHEDSDSIAKVHLSSFRGFFLTLLGRRFLQLLYSEILNERGSVSLVAVSPDNEVVGFVVGVANQVGLYNRLAAKRWPAFALAASGMALRHPSIIPRLWRAFKYPALAAQASCPALLMSLAVAPEVKGEGIGTSLIESFLNHMAQNGVDRVCLTTDRDHNESTNRFYRKCGFSVARQFCTPEGRWMNEYVIQTKNDE